MILEFLYFCQIHFEMFRDLLNLSVPNSLIFQVPFHPFLFMFLQYNQQILELFYPYRFSNIHNYVQGRLASVNIDLVVFPLPHIIPTSLISLVSEIEAVALLNKLDDLNLYL
jgi:hypothetical protein